MLENLLRRFSTASMLWKYAVLAYYAMLENRLRHFSSLFDREHAMVIRGGTREVGFFPIFSRISPFSQTCLIT